MKKIYTILTVIIFTVTYSFAQPNITASNFNPVLGQAITYHTFTPTSLTPGSSGANQNWNFASTPNSGTVSFTYVTPASTPYGASFPSANLAANHNGAYEYQIANTNFLARAGAWASGVTIPYSDAENLIAFPFTYNSTYTDNFAATFVSSGYTFNRSGSVNGTADGYGTLVLPWGTLTNVLRIHTTENYQDVWAFGTINYSSDNYYWVKPGTHYFLYSLAALTANGSTSYGGSYIDQTSVGINQVDPGEVSLSIFPNPASENLSVHFNLRESVSVRISISNLLGQEVFSSEEGSIYAGNFEKAIDVSGLREGLYFLNIKMDDTITTSKLVINR